MSISEAAAGRGARIPGGGRKTELVEMVEKYTPIY